MLWQKSVKTKIVNYLRIFYVVFFRVAMNSFLPLKVCLLILTAFKWRVNYFFCNFFVFSFFCNKCYPVSKIIDSSLIPLLNVKKTFYIIISNDLLKLKIVSGITADNLKNDTKNPLRCIFANIYSNRD